MLRDMFVQVGRPPVGGRGMRVESVGLGMHSVHNTRRRIVAKKLAPTMIVRLQSAVPDGANKWLYGWLEAEWREQFGAWFQKPGGKSSGDKDRGPAKNFAELTNTAIKAFHGVPIDDLPADISVLPITAGGLATHVPMMELTASDDQSLQYWFYAMNGAGVTCPAVPASALPPAGPRIVS